MTYQQLNTYYAPTTEMIKNGDREAFRKRINACRPGTTLTIDQINAFIEENLNGEDAPRLADKFTPAQKAARKKLSDELYRYFVDTIEDSAFAGKPATKGKRYPEDMMMTNGSSPKEKERNARIKELFDDPSVDPAAFVQLHKELFDRMEALDPLKMVTETWTDEQMVNNPGDFMFLSYMGLQFQNFTLELDRVKDLQLDEKTRRDLDRIYAQIAKYEPMSEILSNFAERLGMIANPYYAMIDIDDPETVKVCQLFEGRGLLDASDMEPEPEEEEEKLGGKTDRKDNFDILPGRINQVQTATVSSEISAARRILADGGCKPEDMCFRVIGPDGAEGPEQPFKRDAIMLGVGSDTRKRAVVYDRTDRDATELTVQGGHTELSALIVRSLTSRKPPQQPYCEEPGDPPEAPGIGSRIMHALFSRYDAARFAAYEADMTAYRDHQRRYEAYLEEHRRWRKERDVFDKAYPDFNDVKPGRLISDAEMVRREDDLTLEDGIRTICGVFGADRPRRDDWIHENVYAEREYRTMAEGNLSLSAMRPEGMELDDTTFASLSMVMGLSPQYIAGLKGAPDSAAFDDIIQEAAGHPPRANIHYFLGATIEPARRRVFDCLTHFDAPLTEGQPATGKEELAQLLAPAINTAVEHMGTKRWGSQVPVILNETINKVLTFCEQHGMTEQLKAAGLSQKSIDIVRAGQLAGRIYMEGKQAEMTLLRESEQGVTLTEAQRRTCVDQIARAKTLNAVCSRWVDSYKPDFEDLPVKQKGETEAAYQQRLADYNVRMMAFMDKGDAGRKEPAAEVLDLLNGGEQIDRLAERLMPAEERERLSREGSRAALTTMVMNINCFGERLKNAAPEVEAQPEKQPEPEVQAEKQAEKQAEPEVQAEKQPEPEKPQEAPVKLSKFSKMMQELEKKQPFGEDEPLPEALKENIRGMSERSGEGMLFLERNVREGKPFVGGKAVKDVVVFRALERISEAEKPDAEKLSVFSRDDSDEICSVIADQTKEVRFAADRVHDADFYGRNLLDEQGLDDLSDRFDERLGFVIADAKQKIKSEDDLAHYKENMLREARAPQAEEDDGLAHYRENMLKL